MGSYVLKGRVIDAISDSPLENGMVVTEGDRITYAGPYVEQKVPKNAVIVEGEDATIMPGLIDCHVHVNMANPVGMMNQMELDPVMLALETLKPMETLLMGGFTTIRDMCGFGIPLKKAQERGLIRGPRLFEGSKIICMTGGHGDSNHFLTKAQVNSLRSVSHIADGVAECIEAARLMLREGNQFIKIASTGGVSSSGSEITDVQFSVEEIRAMVDEAERHGTYVASHSENGKGVHQAVLGGVHTIEHGIDIADETLELMVKQGTIFCPTLTVCRVAANSPRLPEFVRRKASQAAKTHAKCTKKAYEAGIPLVFGTDYARGLLSDEFFRCHGEEFEVLMEVTGCSAMEAIKMASSEAAKVVKMADSIGTIEEGKLADLIMVEGDPLKNITLLRDNDTIGFVMQGGVVMKNMLTAQQL